VRRALRIPLVTTLLAAAAGTLAAQTGALPPSPTLPSDTLEANYGPRSEVGPSPQLAPTLPSDTLEATQPVDSLPADSLGHSSSSQAPRSDDLLPDAAPATPGDSAALRELKSWIRRHRGLMMPPPVRAVLIRA
jgi:hypothetical protein